MFRKIFSHERSTEVVENSVRNKWRNVTSVNCIWKDFHHCETFVARTTIYVPSCIQSRALAQVYTNLRAIFFTAIQKKHRGDKNIYVDGNKSIDTLKRRKQKNDKNEKSQSARRLNRKDATTFKAERTLWRVIIYVSYREIHWNEKLLRSLHSNIRK